METIPHSCQCVVVVIQRGFSPSFPLLPTSSGTPGKCERSSLGWNWIAEGSPGELTDIRVVSKARSCCTHRIAHLCFVAVFTIWTYIWIMLRVGCKVENCFFLTPPSLVLSSVVTGLGLGSAGGKCERSSRNWIAGRWVADTSADCVLAGLMVSSPAGLGRRVCTLSLSTPLNNTQVSREIPGKRDHAGIETQAKAWMSCISH